MGDPPFLPKLCLLLCLLFAKTGRSRKARKNRCFLSYLLPLASAAHVTAKFAKVSFTGEIKTQDTRAAAPLGEQKGPGGHDAAPVGEKHAPFGREAAPVGEQRCPGGHDAAPVGEKQAPWEPHTAPVGEQRCPGGHDAPTRE